LSFDGFSAAAPLLLGPDDRYLRVTITAEKTTSMISAWRRGGGVKNIINIFY